MSDKELEAAYQAYLQSKGGGLIGNAGARYTYMTGKMLNYMTSTENNTGITNLDMLKSEMSWEKTQIESGRSVLSLALSPRAASFLNMYTQYLMQQHFFGNNASENNNGMFNDGTDDTLYSGHLFTDNDDYTCFTYDIDINMSDARNPVSDYRKGTTYRWDGNYLNSARPEIVYYPYNADTTKSYTPNYYYYVNGPRTYDYISIVNNNNSGYILYGYESNSKYNTRTDYYGRVIVVYSTVSKYYVIGVESTNSDRGKYTIRCDYSKDRIYPKEVTSANIIFYTNNNNNINVYPSVNDIDVNGRLSITPKVNVGVSPEINYQPYYIEEGDTINNIVNNYYEDSGDKDKTITIPEIGNPSGGGGNDNPDNPDNPSGGTGGNPPNWSNPYPSITQGSDGVFNFNFHLPDLNIDWNISGLSEKFPFSIPFDFIAFCRVLNAEPECPEWSGDLVLPMYTHHFDISFEQFDDLAALLRNLEFIGFCIGLILATRALIKG